MHTHKTHALEARIFLVCAFVPCSIVIFHMLSAALRGSGLLVATFELLDAPDEDFQSYAGISKLLAYLLRCMKGNVAHTHARTRTHAHMRTRALRKGETCASEELMHDYMPAKGITI